MVSQIRLRLETIQTHQKVSGEADFLLGVLGEVSLGESLVLSPEAGRPLLFSSRVRAGCGTRSVLEVRL